jgi:DNA replication protein DnaC
MRTPLFIGGREVAVKRVCDPCINKEKEQMLSLEMKQAGFLHRVAVHDREAMMLEMLEQMGANPWEHGDACFDRYDVAERGADALNKARDFAAAVASADRYTPVRGFYLYGETGTDKSDLVVAIVKWLVQQGYDPKQIVFDQAAELIARIQDTYGRKEASTMDVLEKRFNAGLWILDDMGTERPSDDVARHLTLIFSRRAMRPTLITSNFGPKKLQDERPEFFRIVSRLGPKYFRVAELKGKDRRFDV